MPTAYLADLPIRLDVDVLTRLLMSHMPWSDPTRKLTRKESAARIALKALVQLAIDSMDEDIRRGKLNVPPPGRCPKGADFIEWGFCYLMRVWSHIEQDATYDIRFTENGDGSITLTGLGPAPALVSAAAVVDSLPHAPASRAALPAATVADPVSGGCDSSQPVGSLVHRGLYGERQDGVCETVGEAAPAALPVHESLHP